MFTDKGILVADEGLYTKQGRTDGRVWLSLEGGKENEIIQLMSKETITSGGL